MLPANIAVLPKFYLGSAIASSVLDSASQCVERELCCLGNEIPRPPSTGTTSLPLQMNGKIPLYTTSMKNSSGSSNIFTIMLGKQSLQVSKRRLASNILELIRQHGIARATGNHQQTSELAKLCRETIREDLQDRRAAVVDEADEAGKSIRKTRRSFINHKTKMPSLRRPDGTVIASRRAMDKARRMYRSFGSPFRNTTCQKVDEELCGARFR
ncbi:hypothetical protein V3C99_006336 [Haemonchus contortus]